MQWPIQDIFLANHASIFTPLFALNIIFRENFFISIFLIILAFLTLLIIARFVRVVWIRLLLYLPEQPLFSIFTKLVIIVIFGFLRILL